MEAATFASNLVDRLLLRSLEQKVAKRSAEAQETIARLVRAADLRIAACEAQTDERTVAAMLSLYREAATLLAAAVLEDEGEHTELVREHVWDKFAGWRERQSDAPKAIDEARAFFSSTDLLAADAKSRDEQLVLREKAHQACAWLRARVDPRSPKDVRVARKVRIIMLALIAALVVGWTIRTLTQPKNWARGATVTMSSQYPGSPNPEALVNGEIEGKFGGHTNVQEQPWILVDLGQERSIKEIRVYNRGDEYAHETIPLDLEVSLDGVHYETIDRRATPFSQSDPWVVRRSTTARFVRLSKSGHGYIALAEIEVY
jgi:hypothetical protein